MKMGSLSKRKIYVVGPNKAAANWMEGRLTNKFYDADVILFTGGEDVSAHLYGKRPHHTAYYNHQRDQYEIKAFKKARECGIPMVGICRGAQLLTTRAGGLLVQHQVHDFIHHIKTNDDREMMVNSIHHQRMYPFNLPDDDYELLAWAIEEDGNENVSPFSFGEDDEDDMSGDKEVEMLYLPKIKAVCIQSHPEMAYHPESDEQYEFIDYCRELVETRLGI